MKADQERVRNLLIDTVGLLCRNGLAFQHELKVEGLLGITLDNNDVFLVNISQVFQGETAGVSAKTAASESYEVDATETSQSGGYDSNDEADRDMSYAIKEEVRDEDDDDVYIVTKQEEVSVKEEPCDVRVPSPHDIRVPPPHGPVMNVESRSFDATNFSGMFPSGSDSSGGPPRKRRATDFNVPNTMNSPQIMNSPGPSAALGSMSMMARGPPGSSGPGGGEGAGEGSFSLDAWTNSQLQGQPLDPAQAEQMMAALGLSGTRPRRAKNAQDKNFTCMVEGCGKTFYQRCAMYKHQREKHGAQYHRPR